MKHNLLCDYYIYIYSEWLQVFYQTVKNMIDDKDARLKAFVRNKTKEALLKCGRKLVINEGINALSARKLAQAANSSVGMIYNIFATMDNFIAEQNAMTLNELSAKMSSLTMSKNPFNNLNHYADVLASYIMANPNLWALLYNRYLSGDGFKLTIAEARIIKKIDILISFQVVPLIKKMSAKEKKVSIKVLEMALFAMSGYLLSDRLNNKSSLNKETLCKLLMNTYIAGMVSLEDIK